MVLGRIKGVKEFAKECKEKGIEFNLITALISKNYRKQKHRERLDYCRRNSKKRGYIMSDNSPGNLFDEILIDKIYNIDGFKPNKNDTVIDVGAYYGDSAVWWAKEFSAKVIAFEPLPEAYTELLENAKLNKVNDKIKAYNVALGDGKDITGGKGKGTMFNFSNKESTFQTRTLDSFALDKADILKIDVEGFEYGVLNGAVNTINKFKPKIILETHSKELRRKCNEFLDSVGYKLEFEGRTSISKQKGFDEVTNLFYAPM